MDAFALARAFGFTLEPVAEREARRDGRHIYYPARVHLERQHFQVALQVAHFLLREARVAESELAVKYVAGALMMPERRFSKDLRRTWNVVELKAIHSNCSAEAIARRIVALRPACVSIRDSGRLKDRFVSPLVAGRNLGRITPYEVELAKRVLEAGESVQDSSLLWGCAVFQGSWRRVITVCDAEELEARLVFDGQSYAP